MSLYKSSPMKIAPCEEGCPTCEFLNGSKSVGVMLKVIENLDHMLAEAEKLNWSLTSVLSAKVEGKDAATKEHEP